MQTIRHFTLGKVSQVTFILSFYQQRIAINIDLNVLFPAHFCHFPRQIISLAQKNYGC